MSDVHVRKSNRGRKKSLTDSTRKLHKQDNSAKYNKTRIWIGAEYDRWTALKDRCLTDKNTHRSCKNSAG